MRISILLRVGMHSNLYCTTYSKSPLSLVCDFETYQNGSTFVRMEYMSIILIISYQKSSSHESEIERISKL